MEIDSKSKLAKFVIIILFSIFVSSNLMADIHHEQHEYFDCALNKTFNRPLFVNAITYGKELTLREVIFNLLNLDLEYRKKFLNQILDKSSLVFAPDYELKTFRYNQVNFSKQAACLLEKFKKGYTIRSFSIDSANYESRGYAFLNKNKLVTIAVVHSLHIN